MRKVSLLIPTERTYPVLPSRFHSSFNSRIWVSDEYGPYIYLFSANGSLIQTIQPPDAILPMDDNGNLNFTSETDPATGRAGNKGRSRF